MRYSIIFCLFMSFYSIVAMEKEQEEKKIEELLPDISITDLNAEKSKFKKYDLVHPEKFLTLLRNRLNKEANGIIYLKNLQLFASKLQCQHVMAQGNAFLAYVYKHKAQLNKKHDEILRQLAPGHIIFRKMIAVSPETPEQINEMLVHSKIFSEYRIYSPDELKIIFSRILDPQYGAWLNKVALTKAYAHEALLAQGLEQALGKIPSQLFIDLTESELLNTQKNSNLITENTKYLNNSIDAYITLLEKTQKQKDKTKASPEIEEAFEKEEIKNSNLYFLFHKYYEQLYKIVRQEMQDTIKELIKMHLPPGDIAFIKSLAHYNLSLPEASRQEKLLAEQLPAELPPFQDPKQTIKLPSLDLEIQNFAKEMQVTHPIEQPSKIVIQPKKTRKKIRRKKPVPTQSTSPQIAQEEQAEKKEIEIIESEQKKIAESKIDGSYILEGEETDKNITIHNPTNNTIEVIFKTDKPKQIAQQLPPINYTQWVQMWFKDPQQALETQGYTKEGTKKYTPENLRWKPIALHAFSRLVDTFIKQWGTATTVPSRKNPGQQDLLVTLPGKIIYPDGTEETGVFAYLIDSKNGMWYHRMFEPQTGQKLISDLFEKGYFSPEMKGYYDVFFPELPKKK